MLAQAPRLQWDFSPLSLFRMVVLLAHVFIFISSKFKSSLLDHYKGAIVKAEERNIFYLTLLA